MRKQSSSSNEHYPSFLQDYGKLFSHFQSEFAPLNSKQRGDYFAEFTRRLIPHTEIGGRFERPQMRKQTHDEGVDLECQSREGTELLYAQAKYTIPGVDDIDLIMSKFKAYQERQQLTPQPQLLFQALDDSELTKVHFVIVTMQDLSSRIIPKYEGSRRSTVQFFSLLKSEGRIHIIDGPEILSVLREVYRKSYQLPSGLDLVMATPYINLKNVYVGIIAASELKKLYDLFGDSLFFENIREYLGTTSGKVKSGRGRITVNEAIAGTLLDEPDKFLARNNGITFRAGSIKVIDDKRLKLNDASIVNGCQTTMSIVRNAPDDCFVLVKIVQASDTWDIARAANFQNKIEQLDLELAQYIRPQMVRSAASSFSFQYKGAADEDSAFAVVDAIYSREITQEEFRAIFLGLFSNSPRNSISANYTEVKTDVISQLFQEGNSDRDFIFETILKIQHATREGALQVEESLRGDEGLAYLFQRFWKEDKPHYRAFLAVLAACGCTNNNIYSKQGGPTYQDMITFLDNVRSIIEECTDTFLRYYQLAFTSVALDSIKEDQDREQMLQHMKTAIERASFQNLFLKLRALANTDSSVRPLHTDILTTPE